MVIFTETLLADSFLITPEKIDDERGYFTRIFDKNEFKKRNLIYDFVQDSISFNKTKGTIRGMHFQLSPFEEAKIVSCINGKIFDVIIDLRPDSPTYMDWISFELSSQNYKMIYIPKGFAHGFQTLQDDTEIFYHMSDCYMPKNANGIAWNDKSINIKWPIENPIISDNDKSY